MNKRKLLFNALGSVMLLASCGGNVTSENREMDRFVSELMEKMTIEEKIGQLCQCSGGFATGPNNTKIDRTEDISKGLLGSMLNVSGVANTRKYQEAAMKSRLQIPLIFGLDVIHGFRTGFPLPLAEAASFDLEAIERSARCSAREAAAAGLHWTFAPMVDIGWDARWGRVMEGAGEDPYYGVKVAKARVHGLQGDDLSDESTIMACIKHFAGYGAPIAGMGEMINHRYAADEKEAALKGITAGLDMEMVSECYSKNLKALVEEGKVDEKLVDDAVRRILEQKYKLGLFEDPFKYCNEEREKSVIGSKQSREDACYVAERSIVLLKNDKNILPLSKDVKRISLVGALAKSQKDMCGAWSCADVSKVVTLYDAMCERGYNVDYVEGYNLENNKIVDLNRTLSSARNSDVVIVAMGERAWQSGEMRSKGDISIAEEQQKLVSELVKTGKPVVVLMMCGRPVIFNEVRKNAPAILCTWWLSSEAGNAICNVLWGDYNPSGKLPMTFPQHNGQIPLNYQYKSTGRPTANGGWCAKYIDIPTEPAYPFGYGLSYTSFEYSDLKVNDSVNGDVYANVSVNVKNTGKYKGEEVVQLYVRDEVASVTRPIKELKGFEKISLEPGESKTVTFDITDEQLGFYNNNMDYVVEKGDFTFMVGTNSKDVQSIKYTLK